LKSRKELDAWIRGQKPKAFDPTTENALSASVRAVRRAMNDTVDNAVPRADVKWSLNRQSKLYDALENIDPKAAAEGANVLLRLSHKVAGVGPARTRFIQTLGTVTGLGIVGASAAFSPAVAQGLLAAGIVYGSGKFIMSPSAKKSVAAILRATDKAIMSSKDPSMIRMLRADRAVVADMLKNSELMKEETNGTKVQQ